jgi:minor extracellular serine protease Vpr
MNPNKGNKFFHTIISFSKSISLAISFVFLTLPFNGFVNSSNSINIPQKSTATDERKVLLQDIPNLHKFSSYSRHLLSDLKLDGYKKIKNYRPSEKITRKYPVKIINQRYYIGALIKINKKFNRSDLLKYDVLIGTRAGDILSVTVPIENLEELSKIEGIDFIQIDEPVKQQLDDVKLFTLTNYVHQGYQLPKSYTGKDVIVGIIDRGFDFTHPVFWDTNFTSYRIKRVWLMEDSSGPPPSNYNYGREVVGEENIRNLSYDFRDETHGTHVAGIAGGGFSGNPIHKYKGIAPESELIIVSTSGYLNNFIDGLNYIFNYARAVNKPAVVNLSWGGWLGPHDGTSLFDQAVDNLIGPGKIVVGSAGNEGAVPVHLSKNFTSTDTLLFSFVEFHSSLWGGTPRGKAIVDIWGDENTSFSVFVGIYNTGKNSWEDYTPTISSNFNASYVDTLYDDDFIAPDLCFVSITAVDKNPINNKPNIQIYFDNTDQDFLDENDYVVIGIIARNTKVHAWLARIEPCYFTDKGYSYPVKSGDSDYTVMEIGGTGKSIISVGAFTSKNEYKDFKGNTRRAPFYTSIGEIAPFSSKGPTVDGRIKPDITAPGNVVVSAVSRFDSHFDSNSPLVVSGLTDGTNTWWFAALQGTSMSAPVVTGIIALMLSANPQLSPSQIKGIFQTTSITDNYTGITPNNTWGWGKVNAFLSLKEISTPTPESSTQWSIKISSKVDSLSDLNNFAAVHPLASDSLDPYDIPKPPAPNSNYVYLYFPHPEWGGPGPYYSKDTRRARDLTNETIEWLFNVKTDQTGKNVLIIFEPDSLFPSNYTIVLYDLDAGIRKVLSQSDNTYTYNSGSVGERHFKLVVGGLFKTRKFQAGWNLVGIPLSIDSTLSSMFSDDVSTFYIYTYTFREGYKIDTTFTLGKGFWLGLLDSAVVDFSGTPVKDTISTDLDKYWNIISIPYLTPITKGNIFVERSGVKIPFDSAVSSGWISSSLFGYDPRTKSYYLSDTLEPWLGYWFATLKDSLKLIYTPSSTAPSPKVIFADVKSDDRNWNVILSARLGDVLDKLAFFGVRDGASDGIDRFDYPKPPLPPGEKAIQVYFYHPEWNFELGPYFASDIRASFGDVKSWKFYVRCLSGGEVKLSWDLSQVPGRFNFTLFDVSSGRVVDMRSVSEYVYNAVNNETREFRIDAVTGVSEENTIPKSYALYQNYPNPFNPSTTIEFDIPERTNVKLVIYDILGREVETLIDKELEPGKYKLNFNATNLPTGVYFYRLQAGNFIEQKKMILIK